MLLRRQTPWLVVGGGVGGGSGSTDGGIPLPDGGAVFAEMTYFVTSCGTGTGGDLRGDAGDGLAGADAFCKSLATALSPSLGAKTWRAYLSTNTVNARSRIGLGPWRNSKGVQIAANLDETGRPVPITNPNLQDILTGTKQDGTVFPAQHCNNWTANNGNTFTARVGHSNRAGGGRGSFYCFAAD